jgi:hypothetical protein
LLHIPAVRAIAHQGIGLHPKENELLRLANTLHNDDVCRMLCAIDEVNRLAVANRFYAVNVQPRSELGLRGISENRESAMIPLTDEQKKALETALCYFKPILEKYGVPAIIQRLRDNIIKRYEAAPAKIMTEAGEVLCLPTTYEDFKKLSLSDHDYQKALKAYYAHKTHGALRCMMRPNRWIRPDGTAFLMSDPNRPGEFWVTDRFDTVIAVIYLSVIDTTLPCIRDFTPESRLIYFLEEGLAVINRAHNFDAGHEKGVYEDDEKEDNPSCGPGMESRLMEAGQVGCALLNYLDRRLLDALIETVAFNFYKTQLNHQNIPDIYKSITEVVYD